MELDELLLELRVHLEVASIAAALARRAIAPTLPLEGHHVVYGEEKSAGGGGEGNEEGYVLEGIFPMGSIID